MATNVCIKKKNKKRSYSGNYHRRYMKWNRILKRNTRKRLRQRFKRIIENDDAGFKIEEHCSKNAERYRGLNKAYNSSPKTDYKMNYSPSINLNNIKYKNMYNDFKTIKLE
eukprot:347143_1